MILLPDDTEGPSNPKAVEARTLTVNRMEADPPPAYELEGPSFVAPQLPPPQPQLFQGPPLPPADVRPTNFLSVATRDRAVRGQYVIDPKIRVPLQMLAPLEKYETEETRKNLWLRTKDGSVDADVWVLGGGGDGMEWKDRQKAKLGVKTKDGRVSLRLHSLAPSPFAPRTPISLFMKTKDGSLRLSLPRAFMGPLTITRKDARYRFSPALSAVTTVFSDSRGVTRCFVGNLAHSGWADAPGAWGGDEVDIITHDGRVWVQFDDEVEEEKAKSPMKEFFDRVFGV